MMERRARPRVEPPPGLPPGAASDVVEETFLLAGHTVRMLRPRDDDALLDELLAEADQDEDRLPFWAQLWPSGAVLAREVAGRCLAGRRVLELGSGLGLVAVAAALSGARVLAVDRSPEATTFTAANAARNGLTVQTAVCPFEQPERLLAGAPWDLVVAADVLYEQRNVPVLVWLLPRLVEVTGEVWLADPGRPMLASFLAGVDATGWRREQLATDPAGMTIHRLRLEAGTAVPRVPASGQVRPRA
jgi:predicted nicotinamide N-methyase